VEGTGGRLIEMLSRHLPRCAEGKTESVIDLICYSMK
jgi:hypothetical protein